MLQTLGYTADPQTTPNVSINAVIDRDVFLEDNEWTGYREGLFSYVCSYEIVPAVRVSHLQIIDPTSQERLRIRGLAIVVSAVTDGHRQQKVELVQTTGENSRHIGPPREVYLAPKLQSPHQDLGAGGRILTHGYQYSHAWPSHVPRPPGESPQRLPTNTHLNGFSSSSSKILLSNSDMRDAPHRNTFG